MQRTVGCKVQGSCATLYDCVHTGWEPKCQYVMAVGSVYAALLCCKHMCVWVREY